MRKILTKDVIDDMIEEAKASFFTSDRPEREKKLLKDIVPFVFFNDRLKTTWGRAWICHSYNPDRHAIGIDKNFKRVKVEGRKSWFILEMNPASQYAPINEVRDTVYHELAHLLDFRLTGWYTRYNEDHHQGWREIHLAMGGNGESHGPEHIDLSHFKKFRNLCHWRG
jgi:hypothetical protein